MKIKNTCARLIDLNVIVGGKEESFRFMPAGDAVEIPESVVKLAYTKALMADGSLSAVSGSDEDFGMTSLLEQADELGITVDKRWGQDRLTEEINKKLDE